MNKVALLLEFNHQQTQLIDNNNYQVGQLNTENLFRNQLD